MRKLATAALLLGALAAACSRSSDPAPENSASTTAPAARDLTLLDALPPAPDAAPAVVSARELAVPHAEPLVAAPSRHQSARAVAHSAPARRPTAPVRAAASPLTVPTPATLAVSAPAPAPAPVARGAGTALEPGESVTQLPATAAAPGSLPPVDLVSDRDLHRHPFVIIGDDRCIPRRGDLFPRPRHFR
ncbi:MAG TPA: hypothetical protein VFW66_11705 [Gemmatimonadales bacterium]|nr:hypothetical protein [Gemmatimonadales bacterium]